MGDGWCARAYNRVAMSSTTTRATLIVCFCTGCRERNRPEAVFCAQCGHVLEPAGLEYADGFAPGSSANHRVDHLGELLCWAMAVAGIMILAATFLGIIGRVVG